MSNDNHLKLKNGTIVNINDLSNLTAEERTELFDTPMNMYEGLQIKNDLSSIKDSLAETLIAFNSHSISCPIQKETVNNMIDTRFKNNIKESILTSGNIAKAITAIFFLVAGFGTLFFIIIQQIK